MPACERSCSVTGGVHSYRNLSHREYQSLNWVSPDQPELRKLEVGLDNICRSTCIPCSAANSTSIGHLDRANGAVIQIEPNTQQLDLTQLDGQISHLEVLKFFGGEPLISPRLVQLVDMVLAQSPRLRYVNLTTGLNGIKESNLQALARLAERGIKVYCNVSIDAEPELNAWIRGHQLDSFWSSWNMLDSYRPQIILQKFQPTIGIYNVFAFPEYLKFLQQLVNDYKISAPIIIANTIVKPEELHPRELEESAKSWTVKRLQEARSWAPQWGQSLINTALFNLKESPTIDWTQVLARANQYPQWRGDSRSWDWWYNHYVNSAVI